MKAIYKFHFNCGRMGDLHGLFIAEMVKVSDLVASGREVHFGEVLGKHSDISGPIEGTDLTLLSADPADIAVFERLNASVGFNPFDYIEEEEGEPDDE